MEVYIASMGPRSSDRGNELAATYGLTPNTVLQWGRDHLIAEMLQNLSLPCYPLLWLQWGRDHLIAEIFEFFPKEGMNPMCFNGAAII